MGHLVAKGPAATAARLASVVAVTLVVCVAFPTVTAADTYGGGGPDEGYRADNYTHTFCHGPGLDTALYNNVDGRMSNLDVQTRFTDSYGTCNSTNTDITFVNADLSGGTFGQWVCIDFVDGSSTRCDQYRVTIDPAAHPNDYQTSSTVCHEIGHTVGLRHGGTTDCMINDLFYPENEAGITYNSHHVTHINNQS